MSTVPAANAPESATRIRTAPPLVLAAVELGVLPMPQAVAFHAARAAEAARLANLLSA